MVYGNKKTRENTYFFGQMQKCPPDTIWGTLSETIFQTYFDFWANQIIHMLFIIYKSMSFK